MLLCANATQAMGTSPSPVGSTVSKLWLLRRDALSGPETAGPASEVLSRDAQQIRLPAPKLRDLSSIPGTHVVDGENGLPHVAL